MSDLATTGLRALRKAIDKVVDAHRASGRPMAVWKDGKVAKIVPGAATAVREQSQEYPRGGEDRE
jgi:hypothetical protein